MIFPVLTTRPIGSSLIREGRVPGRPTHMAANSAPLPSRSNYDAIGLHIEHVAIGRISPAVRPLKKHRKQYIAKLAAGISRFGLLVPMLVDEDYRLVAGHARLAAAQVLKLQTVPVIRVDHLTEEQLRTLAIYENKIVQESEFDEAALNLEFEELRLVEPEIELTDSGFAIGEIDALAGESRPRRSTILIMPRKNHRRVPRSVGRAICGGAGATGSSAGTRPTRRLSKRWSMARRSASSSRTVRTIFRRAPFQARAGTVISRWPPARWTRPRSSIS